MTESDWFAVLYRGAYHELVLAVFSLTRDLAVAEDVVQEAFAVAYRRRDRLERAENQVAWLRTVAINLARRRKVLDRLRGKHREVAVEITAIPQPPDVDHVVRRSDRQAARRRSIVALAAVAVVLAVVVPLMQSGTNTPTGLKDTIVALDFADPTHGYALLSDCALNSTADPGCDARTEATRDGTTWLPRTAPTLPGGPDTDLQVLGRDTLVVTQAGVRWFSNDGARTWQRLPQGLASPVDVIPAGGTIRAGCTDWKLASCDTPRILVTIPESGAVAPLSTVPVLERQAAQPVPDGDGAWWISGVDPVGRSPILAVSRDDGRTWLTSVLPLLPGDPENFILGFAVVSGPGVVYATRSSWLSMTGEEPKGLVSGLYRSVDGGRTWELTWSAVPDPVSQLPPVSVIPVVTAKGNVIIATPERAQPVLVSQDGGRSFQPASQPSLGWVTWTRAGYLSDRDRRFSVSSDGITWRELGER